MLLLHTSRARGLLFTLLIFLSVFFKATTGYSVKDNQYNNESQEKFQDNQEEITSTPVLINTLSHSHKLEHNRPIDTTYYHSANNSKRVLVTRNGRIANIWVRKHQDFELQGIIELTGIIVKINFNKDGSQIGVIPDFSYSRLIYPITNDNYMEVCTIKDDSLIREKIHLDLKDVDCQCFNPVDNNELFIIQDGMVIIFKRDGSNGWVEIARIGESKDFFYNNYNPNSMHLDPTIKAISDNIFHDGYYGFDGQTIILRGLNTVTILTRNQHGNWDKSQYELKHVYALAHSSTKNEFISIADIRSIASPYSGPLVKSKVKVYIQYWYFDGNAWKHTQVAELLTARLKSYHFSPDQNGFFLGFEDDTAKVFNKDENNNFSISEIEQWYSFDESTLLHFSSTPYSNDGKTIFSKQKRSPLFMNQGNTWIDPFVSLKSGDSSELLSLQMSHDNKRIVAVFATPADKNDKDKYQVHLFLKHEIASISLIRFILEFTVELDSSAYKVFFIDNSHFAVVGSRDVKIYEIPAVVADNEVAEASME